jgi:hypothetical protein
MHADDRKPAGCCWCDEQQPHVPGRLFTRDYKQVSSQEVQDERTTHYWYLGGSLLCRIEFARLGYSTVSCGDHTMVTTGKKSSIAVCPAYEIEKYQEKEKSYGIESAM